MTFDETGRRLITCARDGTCKMWNYNNGGCLKVFRKKNDSEITSVAYIRIYNNRFIITVGWDRRLTFYDDNLEESSFYCDPNEQWQDDIDNGHREDIVCIAKSDINFIATSGYDGEIIIWNMLSAHIFSKLHSPRPKEYSDIHCKFN
jgi:WD40 repeat protein